MTAGCVFTFFGLCPLDLKILEKCKYIKSQKALTKLKIWLVYVNVKWPNKLATCHQPPQTY